MLFEKLGLALFGPALPFDDTTTSSADQGPKVSFFDAARTIDIGREDSELRLFGKALRLVSFIPLVMMYYACFLTVGPCVST
jgi:hypothetical protein